MRRRHGFTLIELLVVIAIITLLMGILLPALAKARAAANQAKDATQIAQIHKAMITFSRQFDGQFPRPGKINRLAFNGTEMPGVGEEDFTKNTTANLYSACIAQNFFTPQICIGPTEPNGNIVAMNDYNHEQYSPIEDVYWDGDQPGDGPTEPGQGFQADLDVLSHVSYAHEPITGKRARENWNDTLDSQWAMFSNRGVRFGDLDDQDAYEDSKTLLIHGGRKQWVGNVCFADGHTEAADSFVIEGITYVDPVNQQQGEPTPMDNLFNEETALPGFSPQEGSGWDIFLTFTVEVSDDGMQWIESDQDKVWD